MVFHFLFCIIYFQGKLIEEKARELGLAHHIKGRKRLAEEADMDSTAEDKKIKTGQPAFKEPIRM